MDFTVLRYITPQRTLYEQKKKLQR